MATIGKKCHGRQTQRKKEISVFFVDSSYFPLTPETVEELSRSFMMVPLMVNLLLELVSKTRWNKTVSMSPQNSKPRSSCLLTSSVLSLAVCVAILSCLLLRGRLGLFRLRRLSLTNLSRVKYLSGEDFIVGFTRIPFAYQMSTVIIRLVLSISDRYIADVRSRCERTIKTFFAASRALLINYTRIDRKVKKLFIILVPRVDSIKMPYFLMCLFL